MSIFTNDKEFGGFFYDQVTSNLAQADEATIATGYISSQTIDDLSAPILKIIKRGGSFNLIVGMGYYEGLKQNQFDALNNLNNEIKKIKAQDNGIKLLFTRKYHGKIYHFRKDSKETYFAGSSNFSPSGLINNLETNIEVKDQISVTKLKGFFSWLKKSENSAYIDKIEEVKITDSKRFDSISKPKISLKEATRFDTSTLDISKYPSFDISLSNNIERRTQSNLNCYFGKGRLNRTTGIVQPREWFEAELIAHKKDIVKAGPLYPRGDFKVITDDGLSFPCRTQGSYYKNIRSKHSLTILGKWLKLKLQKRGALDPLQPVTRDTFEIYGRDSIKFYKLGNGSFYMEF